MKKLLVIVCICIITALSFMTVNALENKTEYVFDIVSARCETNSDGGYDTTISLYRNKPCTKAIIVMWTYGESDSFISIEAKEVYSFDEAITIHTEADFKNAYVSVWESFSSIKPIAQKVKMGYVQLPTYTVNYYRQNVERNGYDLYSTEDFQSDAFGTVITLDESSVPKYDKFSFDSSNTSNVLSGKVTPEGLVLKVYYNHIVDELELKQVVYRLDTKLLQAFVKIKEEGKLTDTEKPLVKTCMDTIEKVLADAEAGVLVYIENYVSTKYKTDVETARGQLDILKATGGYDGFKNKLTKHLSVADVEYLAKVMFGIDDIYQYEKDHM